MTAPKSLLYTSGVLFTFALFTFLAWAEDLGQQTCSLKGEIVLTGPTEIFCMKDMMIADGTKVITQGHPLTITAVGSIHYGETAAKGAPPARNPGMRIFSFKSPAPQSAAAGPIYIYAHDSFGSLEIHNRGASEKDLSGPITIEYMTRGKSYSQTVDVAAGTKVELVVNGFLLEPKPASSAQEPAPAARPGAQTPATSVAREAAPPANKPRRRRPPPRMQRPPPQYERPPPPFWNWSW